MASDVDIVLEVATKGVEEVYKLSNAMQQLNKVVAGVANPMKNLDARSRALSAAVGSADSSLKAHAKTVDQLARNNAVLTNELGRVRKEIAGMGTEFRFATGASASFRRAAVSDLKAYEGALKGIRLRALTEDLKGVAQEQKRLGKDAQFVGRSLIIGLTTPIMGFARYGLQALVGIDKEFVRLNKVLEGVAPNLDTAAKKMGITLAGATKEQSKQLQGMVDKYNALDRSLTKVSNKFGLAKSLTVGLAGDFAELGIQSEESLAKITELTAATEKLGDMDIGAAKDLVQSLYFQAQRSMQMSGQSRTMTFQEREIAAIGAATAQLNLFNSVENVTALTLRDLGDAFPEVAAAGSSFGLSMTELAGMLAPMKAAGFEVGASANSIKVSLQRLVAPTKQNSDLFKELSKQYNVNFTEIKGTGLDAIQSLVDGFNELKNSAAGQEGAMEFFAKVFGVRQGPRMEVAIAQMADFDEILKSTSYSMDSAEKRLQGFANQAITSANVTKNVNLPVIQSYKDIGIIARIATTQMKEGETRMIDGFGRVTMEQVKAARQVRQAVTDEIVKAQRTKGEDLIGQVGSEAGRAMFIELAGAANAAEVAQRELDFALGSLDTQLSILKNNFKSFAADLISGIKPALEKITDISNKLISAWSNLDDKTKKLISSVTLLFAGATALIGPLIFVFGQFRLAMGSVAKVLFSFLPGLRTMSVEAVAGASAMLRLTKPLTVVGDTVVNTNTKFATFLATLASGEGPVGRLANKIGIMTGALQKQNTASMTLTRSVNAQKAAKVALMEVEGTAGIVASASATPAKGFKALSTATLGPSAMPAMPVMRKLTAAELALPDADRIAHEADVAKKAAEAYTDKYRRTLEKLLAGKPMPLAGGISPTGMYRYPKGSVDASGTKIGGRLLNFGKIKAQADIEAAAYAARIESIENARGLRALKKYNAERIAELRANLTAENKIALERFQQLVFRRDAQVQAILAEENAVRQARNAAQKAAQQAKGIETKLGGVGTGTLIKERFFKGRKIDDDQFDKIMGGGIKGRLTSSKLNLKIFGEKAGDLTEKGAGKFLGGKQTVAAFKGLGTFGKDLFTQPSKAFGDFIGLFKNGFSSITGMFGKIGPMFAKIGGYIKNPISLFMKFKSIIIGLGPAIMTAVSSFGAVTGIGLIIAGVAAIVIILIKNWDQFIAAIQPGIDALKDTFDILKDAVMGLVQPFIDFFATIGGEGEGSNAVVATIATTFNILADIIKVLAIALKFVFVEIFGRIIKVALSSLLAMLKGIGNFIMGLWKVIKGIFTFNWSSIVDGFKKIGKGIAQVAIGLMGPFADFFVFVLKGVKMIFDQLAKLPGWLGGGIFKKASQGIGAAINFIEDTRELKKGKGKGKNTPDVDTDPMQEQIANATGDGLKEGADEGAKELAKRAKQALKDLKREVQEEIASRIKDAMNDVVENIKDALKNQKAAALGIYDAQIKKIEDVAKAEERLTKEQEYQNKLREAEDQRALNRLNNRRSYALAIYAGQIDEARSIADEGARQEAEDTKKIGEINSGRAEELADQNRKDMIDSIKDAKEVASKYFDDMIDKFTNAAKKITEFPPTTAEEFNSMLNTLVNGGDGFIGAVGIAKSIGANFSESFGGALANLGVDAQGPLSSALEAIGKVLTDNNPFGPTGVWNTTIDKTIDALTRKYTGLTNTLTTIINTKSAAFQNLLDIYKKYQNLVNPADSSGGAGGGGGGGNNTNGGYGKGFNNDGVKVGNKVAIASANADLAKIKTYSDKYLDEKYGKTAEGKKLIASIKGTVGAIASSSVLLGGHDEGMKDYMPVVLASKYRDQIRTNSELVYAYIMNNRALFLKGSGAGARTDESGRSGFFKGGMLPYMAGGATKGPAHQGIPALLHGGEYVVRNTAVKKYGWGMMQQINQGTYKPKPYANGGMVNPTRLFQDSSIDRQDPAYKEWVWQQENGGFNYEMLKAIAKKESAKSKTTNGMPDWNDIAGMRKSPNPQKPNDKLSGGFNMPISLWTALGGLQYGKTPGQATMLAQMAINNRLHYFGYKTSNGQLIPPRLLFDHVYPRKERGAAGTSYVQLPEFFDPSKKYRDNLIKDIPGISKRAVKQAFLKSSKEVLEEGFAGGFASEFGKIDYLNYLNQYMKYDQGTWPFRIRMPFSDSAEWYQAKKGQKVNNGFIKNDLVNRIETPDGFFNDAMGRRIPASANLFNGGLIRGYENGGMPLPVPTPKNPGVGSPPPPYKTWAEYFAKKGTTSTPMPFGTSVPWSKEAEKQFKEYIKKGYVDTKTGVFMSPFGDTWSMFSTMADMPGYRWAPEDFIGKHPKRYTLQKITGAEALWKGGHGAGKDWNVWNAKAERERLQGTGLLSGFKALGFNALSLATDLKHSLRRTFMLENVKTMLNSDAPKEVRMMAGFEDIMTLLPMVKGGVKVLKPVVQEARLQAQARTLNKILSMDKILGSYKATGNVGLYGSLRAPIGEAKFDAKEFINQFLKHDPEALYHGPQSGKLPQWLSGEDAVKIERIQQMLEYGQITEDVAKEMLGNLPSISRRSSSQSMLIGPSTYSTQALLGGTTYTLGGNRLSPLRQPGFKPKLFNLVDNFPEMYRGSMDVFTDTAQPRYGQGIFAKLKSFGQKEYVQKRILSQALDINTPLSELLKEIPVTFRQNPKLWTRQKVARILGRDSIFDFDNALMKEPQEITRHDITYDPLDSARRRARTVIKALTTYHSEHPNATLLDLLQSKEQGIPRKIKNIYAHFEGPDAPEFVETIDNFTGLSDFGRNEIIDSLRVPLKFTSKKGAETLKLNFVAPNNNPVLGELYDLLRPDRRPEDYLSSRVADVTRLQPSDFISQEAYEQGMRIVEESKVVRFGRNNPAYIFNPMRPYEVKRNIVQGVASNIKEFGFLKGIKNTMNIERSKTVSIFGKEFKWPKKGGPTINAKGLLEYPGGTVPNQDAVVFKYLLEDFKAPLKTIKPHNLSIKDMGNFADFFKWHTDRIEADIARLLKRKNLSQLGGTRAEQEAARDAAIEQARQRIAHINSLETFVTDIYKATGKPKMARSMPQRFDQIFEQIGMAGYNAREYIHTSQFGKKTPITKPVLLENMLRQLGMMKDMPYLTKSEAYLQFGKMFGYDTIEHTGGVFTRSPFKHTAHMIFDPSILPEPTAVRPANIILEALKREQTGKDITHDMAKDILDVQIAEIQRKIAIIRANTKDGVINKTILKTLFPNMPVGNVTSRAFGGVVPGYGSQGVPAMLHGGEYVINSSAVKNIGLTALQAMNNMRFNTPKTPSYSGQVKGQTTSTSTTHIYVENFIGEKQWFESMMKDYNITVAPQNQRAAGLNNTTISTYSGINRGL